MAKRKAKSNRSHLERARCTRCGGILGPDDEPHEACNAKGPRRPRVLVVLDEETLATLDGMGLKGGRSAAIRALAADYRKRK